MKARNLIAATIVVAFLIGGYLGGLFPKGLLPNFGGGDAIRLGGQSGPDSVDENTKNTLTGVSQTREIDPGDEPADDVSDGDVLAVRIDGRNYAIVRAGREVPASLESLVEQALERRGDAQGVRVRIARSPTSRTTAEIALRDALLDAGLAEDEIEWQGGPRP